MTTRQTFGSALACPWALVRIGSNAPPGRRPASLSWSAPRHASPPKENDNEEQTEREDEKRTDRSRGRRRQFEAVPRLKNPRELYLIPNGERIAYRGKPGTPQAKTWISMKAGYEARDDDRDGIAGIEIRIHGIRVN